MNDKPMTLYDRILLRLMRRRARHHGFDDGPQLVDVKAVRLMGDDDGIRMAEGVDMIPAKVMPQIIEAMGFIPNREEHDPACPRQQGEDLRCNCVQPPTQWTAPPRVQKEMGEDYATALAERQAAKGGD
jgi:hypothetical protein